MTVNIEKEETQYDRLAASLVLCGSENQSCVYKLTISRILFSNVEML